MAVWNPIEYIAAGFVGPLLGFSNVDGAGLGFHVKVL